jgi:hypothetical protein
MRIVTADRPRGAAGILPPEGATLASFVLFASLAVLLAMVYAASEWLHGGFGFPSDAAWARAVFARNIASGQGLCFNPGVPVAGAAGPAWIACIGVLGLVTGKYFVTAKLLGVLFVMLAAILTWYITLDLLGDWRFAFLAALFVAASPRLAAAGISGGEATLAAFLVAAAVHWQAKGWEGTLFQRAVGTAAAALAALSRPELVVLLPLLLLDRWAVTALYAGAEAKRIGRALGRSLPELAGAAAILAPYVVYNWQTGGPLWQQPENALRVQPAWTWAHGVMVGLWADNPLLVCAAVVGLPVALAAAARERSRHPSFALSLVPIVMLAVPGLIWTQARAESAAYAAAYLTPPIAVLAACGLFLAHRAGTKLLRPGVKVAGRVAFGVSIAAVCLAMVVLAAVGHGESWQQHGVDVKKISNLQACLGQRAAERLPPDASIASREVGAIGFFSRRRMVDLGGTISQKGLAYLSRPGSPDTHLWEFLEEERPSHLAIRPGDFPDLSQRGDLLTPFTTFLSSDPRTGGTTTMELYETPWPPPSLREARGDAAALGATP